jgi:putative transposase
MDYRYGSHTVYKIQYHFVFVTKYRYKVLKGDVGLKVRELIRQTCEAFVEKSSKALSVRIMCIFLSLRHPILHRAR